VFALGIAVGRSKVDNKPASGHNRPAYNSKSKKLVALESGGRYLPEYYLMSKPDIDTLKRLENANGLLEANESVFNNRVTPIIERSKKVDYVESILCYK